MQQRRGRRKWCLKTKSLRRVAEMVQRFKNNKVVTCCVRVCVCIWYVCVCSRTVKKAKRRLEERRVIDW